MHKYLPSILSTIWIVIGLTAVHAQPGPRKPTKKPVVKTAPQPPAPKPDLLVRQDGTQLEVLVTEITDKEIVYKRFSNLNGPIFRSQKADFNYLKYGSNGEIEQFAKVVQPKSAPVPASTPPPSAPVAAAPMQQASTSTPAPKDKTRNSSEPFRWRLGVLAGVQGSAVTFDGEPGDRGVGFRGGVMVDNRLGRALTVRAQTLFSAKGDDLLKFNYLEVPFDLLYKIPISNGNILLGGGFYWGKLLSATGGTQDYSHIISSSDAGLRLSVWGDLSSGLTMNVFYNVGLTDINSTGKLYTMKNNSFGLGVGYFLLKK